MINRIRPMAIEVTVNEDSFIVRLKGGSYLRVPLRWFPKLRATTPEQRTAVRISASGTGLHWDQLGEEISVSGLMRDAECHHIEKRLKSVEIAVKIDIDDL